MRHAGFNWKSNILRGITRNLVLGNMSGGHIRMEGDCWSWLRVPWCRNSPGFILSFSSNEFLVPSYIYFFNILQTSPLCKCSLDIVCRLFTAGYSIHSSNSAAGNIHCCCQQFLNQATICIFSFGLLTRSSSAHSSVTATQTVPLDFKTKLIIWEKIEAMWDCCAAGKYHPKSTAVSGTDFDIL